MRGSGASRIAVGACLGLLGLWPVAPVLGQQADLRLVDAVRSGDHGTVRALLLESVDVNVRQPDGATALHWAAYLNDLEMAELLLAAGAVPDASNELGVTPLYLACENGNAALARVLLAGGATAHAVLPSGETALMTAARAGSVGAVRALLAHGADARGRETTEEQTALMWAASQRHSGVVAALLDAGSERPRAFSRPSRGDGAHCPLRAARAPWWWSKRAASRRCCSRHGAEIGPPWSCCSMRVRTPTTSPRPGTSALVVAAHSGHGELAALLLDAGADPNADGAGYNALHAAILRGDETLVETLLAFGADPDARLVRGTRYARQGKLFALDMAWTGASPFFLAAKFGRGDIMRRLAESGADPHAGLDGGVTPLMAAAGMLTRGFGRAGKDRLGREMDSAEMEGRPHAGSRSPRRHGQRHRRGEGSGRIGRRRERRKRYRRHRPCTWPLFTASRPWCATS